MTAATPVLHSPTAGTLIRRTRGRALLAAIVLAGIAARLATLLVPHVYFPDEVFQYLEPAHRLAFGPGVVTWEYREQVRNWLLPVLLAGPMWLGGVMAPGGGAYLLLAKLALLAASLGTVRAAWSLGRGVSRTHALYAALVAATWYEFVYFSTQALTEAVGVTTFLGGAALLQAGRRPALAGALFAFTAVLRFQYGPAAALFVALTLFRTPRRLLPVAAGGAAVLLSSALFDLATGLTPFVWIANNLHQNIVLGRSHVWTDGPLYYPAAMAVVAGPWLAPLLVLAAIGARRYPALAAAAIANVAIHSLIAHKEYRYILLSTAIVAILAAIGTGDMVRLARQRWPGFQRLPVIAGTAWVAMSISIGTRVEPRGWWTGFRSQLAAFEALRSDPALCGVAVYDLMWSASGGYAYLHRPVPFLYYPAGEGARLLRDASAFSAVVSRASVSIPGFQLDRCFPAAAGDPTFCIFRRSGTCTSRALPSEINRTLLRLNK